MAQIQVCVLFKSNNNDNYFHASNFARLDGGFESMHQKVAIDLEEKSVQAENKSIKTKNKYANRIFKKMQTEIKM